MPNQLFVQIQTIISDMEVNSHPKEVTICGKHIHGIRSIILSSHISKHLLGRFFLSVSGLHIKYHVFVSIYKLYAFPNKQIYVKSL